ncbi:antibiotic biosynthesis monooxygenase family protein [Almyronema epifaneia]|uniref:Antibiotic biosynthesis monooxygenase family protein n=1 Tax=Almyronema epifaneia S1 TaxID=2991925 RepID=A0ABW6ICD7_9CYAN
MITFVNVFTVQPESQDRAFHNISQVYTEAVKPQPGFISGQVLKSRDGTRVTAIALWESEADLQAMRTTPKFQAMHTPEFSAAIIANESHVYDELIQVEK